MSDTRETIARIYAMLLAVDYQEELFSDLPDKRKDGQDTKASCPFCHGNDFSYALREPVWRCWNCDKGGDWIEYLIERRGLSFLEAVQELAQDAHIELDGLLADSKEHQAYLRKASLLEAAQKFLQQALWEPAGQPVLQYLLDRGYTEEDVRAMGLGAYADPEALKQALRNQGYSEEALRESGLLSNNLRMALKILEEKIPLLAIPAKDPAGRITGLAFRPPVQDEHLKAKNLDKYRYTAGYEAKEALIGLSSVRGERLVIVVEGILDAGYLNSKGLKVVALGGADLSLQQIRALEANKTRELILALDSDQPGQAGTEKAIRLLSSSKLRAYVASQFGAYKDPDELARAEGIEALKQALRSPQAASSWMARRIISKHDLQSPMGLDQALEEAMEAYVQIEDGIDARAFWESLKKATGLTEEELEGRAGQASQALSAKKSREALKRLQNKLRDREAEGDIIGAELALSQGLQELRSSRGVVAPEPYLLQDIEKDFQAISEGLSTGYEGLDKIARLQEGAISIVAGRPGHGKTTLLLNLLVNLIKAYPERRFYFFSYEEARSRLALKLLMIMAQEVLQKETNQGAYTNYLREKRAKEQNKKIEQALQEYQRLTVAGRLTLSDQRLAGEDLTATIALLARRGDTGAILVDYIQRIPVHGQYSQRYLEIKAISDMLLDQAVRHNLPVIVGAQLNRSAGGGAHPRLEQLREAGDLEQDAHLVLGLYNQSVDEIEEGQQDKAREVDLRISVLKNRSGMAGSSSVLTFDRPILKIRDQGSKSSDWQ